MRVHRVGVFQLRVSQQLIVLHLEVVEGRVLQGDKRVGLVNVVGLVSEDEVVVLSEV